MPFLASFIETLTVLPGVLLVLACSCRWTRLVHSATCWTIVYSAIQCVHPAMALCLDQVETNCRMVTMPTRNISFQLFFITSYPRSACILCMFFRGLLGCPSICYRIEMNCPNLTSIGHSLDFSKLHCRYFF